MANNLNANPWILDTVGSIATTPFKVLRIKWLGNGGGADVLKIRDQHKTGNVKVNVKGSDDLGGDSITVLDSDTVFVGMYLDTISNGTVEVWVE